MSDLKGIFSGDTPEYLNIISQLDFDKHGFGTKEMHTLDAALMKYSPKKDLSKVFIAGIDSTTNTPAAFLPLTRRNGIVSGLFMTSDPDKGVEKFEVEDHLTVWADVTRIMGMALMGEVRYLKLEDGEMASLIEEATNTTDGKLNMLRARDLFIGGDK